MVAAARELERTMASRSSSSSKPQTSSSTMMGAMQLSTFVGAGLGALLFVFARQLLKAIIGNDAVNPDVFAAAMKYVRIRALGMPAAAIIGTAQAACLGMQDISSPLYVLLAAAIVNFMGDMIFVGSSHPLIGGAAGAAWATVFSQYAALAFFMRWLCHQKPKPKNYDRVAVDLNNNMLQLEGGEGPSTGGKDRGTKILRSSIFARLQLERRKHKTQASTTTTTTSSSLSKGDSNRQEESFSVRGLLAGRSGGKDLLKFPAREISNKFTPYVVPVTTTQFGRVSAYVAMSHVVSSSMGTISMAAQQILVSLFYCITPILDSLSLTAQSFVPAIFEKQTSLERAQALRKTSLNFNLAGAAFGGLTAAIVGFIPLLSRFFTSDPSVMILVNTVAPYLVVYFSVGGFMCASEGLLLGQKDLGFLGKMYGGFFFAVPYVMLRIKQAALSTTASVAQGVRLNTVWKVFVGYQLFRTCAWLLRVVMLQRRAYKQAFNSQDGSGEERVAQ